MTRTQQLRSGFTIVELLIVIVVIGILAAITIVAFNGVQSRARAAVLQNDIAQTVRKLEATKVTSSTSTYPAAQTEAALQPSGSNTMNYYYDTLTNRYCLEAYNAATTYFSTGIGQTITSGRCTDSGLAAWWAMNGTANDQSGNGNNGTIANVSNATGQSGATNTAYSYDGTSSNIAVATSASLHPESMSIALWIRPVAWSTEAATVFVSKRSGNTAGYFFHYLSGTQTVQMDMAGSSTRWNTQYTPPLNQWTHMVITTSPSAGRSFYVNGQPYSSSTTMQNPLVVANIALSIGSENGSGYRFNGTMDDLRIYNRVLSDRDVLSLFGQGAQ